MNPATPSAGTDKMLILFLALYSHVSAAFVARVDSFMLPPVARLRPSFARVGLKPRLLTPLGNSGERGSPEPSFLRPKF